jgi:serine O-acetyltransferase
MGVIIGDGCVVGDDVTLFQNVTLGSHGREGLGKAYPVIGNKVTAYANAIIIGGISIGDGATIGALSLVLSDVPQGRIAVGIPAKINSVSADETVH